MEEQLHLKILRAHSLPLWGPNPTNVYIQARLEKETVRTPNVIPKDPDSPDEEFHLYDLSWDIDFYFERKFLPSRIYLHVKEISPLFGDRLIGIAELEIYRLLKENRKNRDIKVTVQCFGRKATAESRGYIDVQFRLQDVPKTGGMKNTPSIFNTIANKIVSSPLNNSLHLPFRKSEFSFIELIGHACQAIKLQRCEAASCTHLKQKLRTLMPPCNEWRDLSEWALQLAACLCAEELLLEECHPETGSLEYSELRSKRGSLEAVVASISRIMRDYTIPPSEILSFYKHPTKFDVVEVLLLLSWLVAISTGKYSSILEPKLFKSSRWSQKGGTFGSDIQKAVERTKAFGLCPHRVWAVASNLPGKELNLLALIPRNPPPFKIHSHITPGNPSHTNCTSGFCEEDVKNFTSVKQLHRCATKDCQLTEEEMFETSKLDIPAENNQTTAWAFDGLSVLDPEEPFLAISHVWADGTGMGTGPSGRVNSCLYSFFCDIARSSGCKGIWWDTICVPKTQPARGKALNNMHMMYQDANYTLVHDLYLLGTPWVDAESACFHLVMSTWFSRGWTALELAKSKNVLVLFGSSNGQGGYVVKDLDKDILAKAGWPSSPPRQVASMAVRGLRDAMTDVNDLITTLGPRYTSWTLDRALIAGLLVGVESSPDDSQPKIYQNIIYKLGVVHDAQLFHEVETLNGSWYPRSIFDLPIAPSIAEPLSVLPNCDVVGYWNMLTLDCENPFEIRNGANIMWREDWPTTSKIQNALLFSEQHIILLVERNVQHPKRGLLVKVMREPINRAMGPDFHFPCQFVGSVTFASHNLMTFDDIRVRIGDTSKLIELNPSEVGSEYVMRTWKKYYDEME